ncbi:hypothetical protein OROHE_014930 [Orobanche hederae]
MVDAIDEYAVGQLKDTTDMPALEEDLKYFYLIYISSCPINVNCEFRTVGHKFTRSGWGFVSAKQSKVAGDEFLIKYSDNENVNLLTTTNANGGLMAIYNKITRRSRCFAFVAVNNSRSRCSSSSCHLPRKIQLVGTHMLTPTLGRKTLAEVKEKLKKQDPNLASPSRARVYFKSRKYKEGHKYKTNRDAIKKRIVNYLNSELFDSVRKTIDEVLREGGDADAVLPGGKHGPDWLVGRQGSFLALENTPAIPQPSADELTAKITRDLESQMEAKVNRKVQENMTWFLKKLGEANPTLKFDIGNFCATFSSDQNESGTPITQTPGGATS